MYSKEQLEGILISGAKCEINVSRDLSASIGYRVRLRVNFRGKKEYLLAIGRTLKQHNILAKFKEQEHKSRPRPILTVTGKAALYGLCNLVPDNIPHNNNWNIFKEARHIVHEVKGHQNSQGLDRILELKGLI